MLKPVITPSCGKLRVLGYCSGSGNTLWKAYELQKQLESTPEGSPFEIVGIFADNPESKAAATAASYGLPCVAIDIRAFYAERDKPLKDREVRAEFDREAISRLEPLGADMVLLAGYVWATTDAVLDRYTSLMSIPPILPSPTRQAGVSLPGPTASRPPSGIRWITSVPVPILRQRNWTRVLCSSVHRRCPWITVCLTTRKPSSATT